MPNTFRALLLALLALYGVRATAQTWWNQDYTKRIPLTITNPGAAATPVPTSAEAVFPTDSIIRADRQDVRVVYFDGASQTEIDSKIFRNPPSPAPWIVENAAAGATSYGTLPGTAVTATLVNGDDGGATVTLPFEFPFGLTTTNKVFMSIDGYLVPGTAQPISQYGRGNAAKPGIYPYTSDYTTLVAGTGMYFAADNNGPGGTARAIFKWEVAESGQTAVIARFAAILYANGDIRFVYSDTVSPTSAGNGGPTSYGEMSYGVEFNAFGNGIIHFPTDNYPTSADFSGHQDILYTSSGVAPSADQVRVVFRLQQPIPAGGNSTGQYFVYYGNPSPQPNAKRNLKNVFDYVADFASLTPDTPAPDWTAGTTDEVVMVRDWQGKRVGVLEYKSAGAGSSFNHAQAWVKSGAMPAFKDLEAYAHMAPYGGGELEQALAVRVVNNPGDPNYGGGIAYATDAFGTYGSDFLVSYVNPVVARGPGTILGGPGRRGHASAYENINLRIVGNLITGKAWKDYDAEPLWTFDNFDRATVNPQHNSVDDPLYTEAGGIGLGTYIQPVAVDFIAIRELRTTSTTGNPQTNAPTDPAIRGTVSSSAGGTIAGATVEISNGTTTDTVTTNAAGKYQLTVPAGVYTVTATAPGHVLGVVGGVSPTVAGETNLTLNSISVNITGVIRGFPDGARVKGAHVVLVDSAGKIVGDTRTDATGAYTLVAPGPGIYSVGGLETPVLTFPNNTARGARASVTVAAVPVTQNLVLGDVVNADFEIPNPDYNSPEGWEGYRYGGTIIPTTQYQYTTAQNHTPGGHYSIALKDALSFNAWMTSIPFLPFPAINGNFNRQFTIYWYPTVEGQKMDMFVRTFNAANGNLGQDQTVVATADATMINKWNAVTATMPANPAATQLSVRLRGETGAGGVMYFDDLTVTATPVAQVFGKVVDENGAPVANAFVGALTADGGLADPSLLDSPVVPTDENGDYHYYAGSTDPIQLAAWAMPTPDANLALPPYGYVIGTADVTPSPNPGSPVNLTIRRAANVMKGAIVTARDSNNTDRGTDAGLPLTNIVDDKWSTRGSTSTPTPNNPNVTFTFDMGTARTIDQINLYWELAVPSDYTLLAGTSADPGSNTLIFSSEAALDADKHGIFNVDYSPSADGPIHAFKVSTPISARYVNIVTRAFSGSLTNYSLIEARALSLAAPLPLTTTDVMRALQIAGGLVTATAGDKTRLDRDGDNRITLLDAARINKAVNGL